ncbi:hypothetical protein LENED_010523 [Lentinula edodes]|uniref:Uncharacterized protein n=1 Tax=Lentinula edodes TaxID=5353 RepID=A0A1Q3EMX9_LENED|nr:hypothetical protein LENED_010523 [Lentinula edodes]
MPRALTVITPSSDISLILHNISIQAIWFLDTLKESPKSMLQDFRTPYPPRSALQIYCYLPNRIELSNQVRRTAQIVKRRGLPGFFIHDSKVIQKYKSNVTSIILFQCFL